MWHVSASLQHNGEWTLDPPRLEQLAIAYLAGVGGDHEWWMPMGETNPFVAHLRVPTTLTEQCAIPPGLVTMDAGEVGQRRPRTRA